MQRVIQVDPKINQPVFNLRVSPSPSRYAVGVLPASRKESLNIVALWEIGTGRAVRELRTLPLESGSTLISPTGQIFLTIGSDHTVRIWDIERVAAAESYSIEGHGFGLALSSTLSI
jgi:WD40 repeat protein